MTAHLPSDKLLSAFLGKSYDDLFQPSVMVGAAAMLEDIDVPAVHAEARSNVEQAVHNAQRGIHDSGARIALITGEGGTGKTHLAVKQLRSLCMVDAAYPVILQMETKVKDEDFERWLLQKTVEGLAASSLYSGANSGLLAKLTKSLLTLVGGQEAREYNDAVNTGDEDLIITAAYNLRTPLRAALRERNFGGVSERTVFALLLTRADIGAGEDYLKGRGGELARSPISLPALTSADERISLLREIALAIGAVRGALVLAFDQIETILQMGSVEILTRTFNQAVALANSVPNLAIIFAALSDAYDVVAERLQQTAQDRISLTEPRPARLDARDPALLKAVIAKRLSALRRRSGFDDTGPDDLSPVPAWVFDRLTSPNIRANLQELTRFRRLAKSMGRLPTEDEFTAASDHMAPEFEIPEPVYVEYDPVAHGHAPNVVATAPLAEPDAAVVAAPEPVAAPVPVTEPALEPVTAAPEPVAATAPPAAAALSLDPAIVQEFDRLWREAQDAFEPAPVPKKAVDQAEILGWALTGLPCERPDLQDFGLKRTAIQGAFTTEVLELSGQRASGQSIERRRIAFADSPVNAFRLRDQIHDIIERSPDAEGLVVLRTPSFPATGENAKAVQDARRAGALVQAVPERDWEKLVRFRKFHDQCSGMPGFDDWRRARRPMLLIPALGQMFEGPRAPSLGPSTPVDAPLADTPIAVAPGLAAIAAPVVVDDLADPTDRVRVWLGDSMQDGRMYWDPNSPTKPLANFGVLVTGDPGRGKTQTIKIFMEAAAKSNLPMLIFDFKNDYADTETAEMFGLDVVRVRTDGLPFNPLRATPEATGKAQPIAHAYEIAGVFRRVFGLGDQQEASFRRALEDAYRNLGIDPQAYADAETLAAPSLSTIIDALEAQGKQDSLLNRVRPLHDLRLVRDDKEIHTDFGSLMNRKVVFALSDLPNDELKAAIAELIIIQVHAHILKGDQPRRLTRMMVFDEAWRVKDSKRLEGLAREGRAFGVGLVIGTQFPGDLPRELAGSLDTKLLLANADPSHQSSILMALLGATGGPQASALRHDLSGLANFEGYIRNLQHAPFAKVRVKPLFLR